MFLYLILSFIINLPGRPVLLLHYSFPLEYLSPPSGSPLIIFIIFLFALMMDPIWDSKRWCKNPLTVESPIKDSKKKNKTASLYNNMTTKLQNYSNTSNSLLRDQNV